MLVIFTYVRDMKEREFLQRCSRGICSSGNERRVRGNKIRSKRLDPITPDVALYPRINGILNPDALELTPLRHERSLDALLLVEGYCLYMGQQPVAYRGGGALGVNPPPKFRRPSRILPNSTRL